MSNLETMKKGLERVEEAHRLLAQTAMEHGIGEGIYGAGYILDAMDSISQAGNFLRMSIEKIENSPKVPRTISEEP